MVVVAFAAACAGARQQPPLATTSPLSPSGQPGTDEPRTPTTPNTSDTPAAQFDCTKLPDVCTFAKSVESVLEQRDVAGSAAISQGVTVACPGPKPTAVGGPFPLCDDSHEGERRTGYRTSNQSRSGLSSADQLANLSIFQRPSQASDSYGGGTNRVFDIGCGNTESPPCANQFVIVASGLPQTLPQRPVYLLTVRMVPGSGYRIVDWLTVLSPSLEILKDGGEAPPDYPVQAYRFYPVSL